MDIFLKKEERMVYTMSMPTIANATVNPRRVDIIANDGYVMYNLDQYTFTDDEGNPRDPLPSEISYFRAFYNLPVTFDFTKIIVVPESDVPANQIFGTGNNTETVTI